MSDCPPGADSVKLAVAAFIFAEMRPVYDRICTGSRGQESPSLLVTMLVSFAGVLEQLMETREGPQASIVVQYSCMARASGATRARIHNGRSTLRGLISLSLSLSLCHALAGDHGELVALRPALFFWDQTARTLHRRTALAPCVAACLSLCCCLLLAACCLLHAACCW